MEQIYANYTASITELKKSPTKLLEMSGNEPIAILNHNKPSAYMIPAEMFEKMMDILDDYFLAKDVEERLNDNEEPIKVSFDEL